MTSASSMREAGHSKPVLWDNPEGWDGEEGGSRVQDGETHVHPCQWVAKTTTILSRNHPPIKINIIIFKKIYHFEVSHSWE